MSPVVAPSTLGETFAERLARLAAEKKAREDYAKGDPMATNPDAPPEGPALASGSAGITSSRGIPSVAMGSGDGIAAPDVAGLSDAIAKAGTPAQPAAAPAPPPVQAPTAAPSTEARLSGMLPPPRASAQEQRVMAANAATQGRQGPITAQNTPLVQPRASTSPMGLSILAGLSTPAKDPGAAPMPAGPVTNMTEETARQQALRERGPRSKWSKVGDALLLAGDVISGHPAAGGRTNNFRQSKLDREASLDRDTNRIQGERDRLQAQLDKEIADKRAAESFELDKKKIEADIKNDAANVEINRMRAETAATNEANTAADRKRDDEFRQQQLLKKETQVKLQLLQPGAILYEYDPISKRTVAIAQNNNQMVTSTDNTTTRSMIVDGKEVKQTETTNTVRRKGPNGTVRIPPSPEVVRSTRAKLLEKARKGGNLTQDQINYLEATGGLQ